MIPKEIVDMLADNGLYIRLSDDGERIQVDVTMNPLTDDMKDLIRENKKELIEYLVMRDWNPKVIAGAIHYIAHRAQKLIDRLPLQQRLRLMDSLSESRNQVWDQYTSLVELYQNFPSSKQQYSQKRITLTACLIEYMRAVKEYVFSVTSDQQTQTA